jgi:hypothetical protein
MWNDPKLVEPFDIIIEDGLHTFEANCIFFENSIHKLNKGGIYIVEDIKKSDMNLFMNVIETIWKYKYRNLQFKLVSLYNINNNYDNNLLLVLNV